MGLVQITGYYSKLMEKVRGGAEIEERERKRERGFGSSHFNAAVMLPGDGFRWLQQPRHCATVQENRLLVEMPRHD
jgi:hypothetical protein